MSEQELTENDEADRLEGDEQENSSDNSRGANKNAAPDREVIEPPDEKSAMALEFVTHVVEDMEIDCQVQLHRPGDSARHDDGKQRPLEEGRSRSNRVGSRHAPILADPLAPGRQWRAARSPVVRWMGMEQQPMQARG